MSVEALESAIKSRRTWPYETRREVPTADLRTATNAVRVARRGPIASGAKDDASVGGRGLGYVSVTTNVWMSWVTACAASIMVKCPEPVMILDCDFATRLAIASIHGVVMPACMGMRLSSE